MVSAILIYQQTIAAMGDEPFDYIGLPFSDSASLQLMATEMNDSWALSYIRQLYGHVYTARTGSLSELVAYGDTFNYQTSLSRVMKKDVQTPVDELVAYRLARQAVFFTQ